MVYCGNCRLATLDLQHKIVEAEVTALNRVLIMGNLTKDPEMRELKGGTTVGDLRLAVKEQFKSKTGEKREEVCYVDVVVWGQLAERCKEYLHKGSPVFVDGRLQYDSWEKDGQKRSMLRIRADNVQFLAAAQDKPVKEKDSYYGWKSKNKAELEGAVKSYPAAWDSVEDETPF